MPPVDPARRSSRPRLARSSALLVLVAALTNAGCLDNPGVDPQPMRLNFPTALETSPPDPERGPRYLYVANSNFDLRFNAGSIQTYDLEALEACDSCTVTGEEECVSVPEGVETGDSPVREKPCDGLLSSEVFVDSFASDLERSPGGGRLYTTVRSRANLTYVELLGGGAQLSCGGGAGPHRCTDEFRRGNESAANDRSIELPADPTGVQVGSLADFDPEGRCGDLGDGELVMVSHRGGQVSLFLEERVGGSGAPALVDVRSGFPDDLVGIELEPETSDAWLPSASELTVGRAGVALDCNNPARSVLFSAGGLALSGVDTGGTGAGDTRAVRFDPRPDVERAYVLSRRPQALLVVDLGRTGPGRLAIDDVVDVCVGPSRLEVGTVEDSDGDPHVLGFVSCFNSRDLYIIDLDSRRLAGVVREMSGPHELALDAARSRLYVADFRTSVIRVIDLTPFEQCLSDSATIRPEVCSPRVKWQIGLERPVVELR